MDCICINPNASNETHFTNTLRLNRSKYSKNIIFSHLNINSIRNKFENLKDVVSNHVDILVSAETKTDKSFPTAQFIVERFHKPLRLDISDKSGGLLVYVIPYLLSRQLIKFEIHSDIQAILFEVNIRKEKWFFLCIYKPPSMDSQYFLDSLFYIRSSHQRPQACNFIKKETLAQVFSCEFCEIFYNTFFTEHLWTTASKIFLIPILMSTSTI